MVKIKYKKNITFFVLFVCFCFSLYGKNDCKSCVRGLYAEIFLKKLKTVKIDGNLYPCDRLVAGCDKNTIYNAIENGVIVPYPDKGRSFLLYIRVGRQLYNFHIKKNAEEPNTNTHVDKTGVSTYKIVAVTDFWNQRLDSKDYEEYVDLRAKSCNIALKNLVSYIYSSGIDRNHYVPFGNKFKKIIGKCCKDEIFASIDNAKVYSLPYNYKSDSLYVIRVNGKTYYIQLHLRIEEGELEGAQTLEEKEEFYRNALWCVRRVYDADGVPFDEKVPIENELYGYLLVPASIQDKDGYVNVREGKSSSSKIVGRLNDNQPFFFTPSKNSDWWRVTLMTPEEDIQFYGYVHKSRILCYDQCTNDVKRKLYDYFRYCLCW